jgi:cysteine desulfurase family protein (TIGR01976 family)
MPANPSVATTEEIRRHFPALARRHQGLAVAYFDGPGGTQVPQQVVEASTDYLLHHNANTHWEYATSHETDAALLAARQAFADFLGGSRGEIAFGANMTTLTFHLARTLGRGWGPGDELVVTELDHHANVDTWRSLEVERGVTIRKVPLRCETGQLDWSALGAALNSKTRLLAIGAASNALGTVNDVKAAADLAHRYGALVFVDAVHYAPHAPIDVQALGGDFLACSAYKFYGPHVGILWGQRERLASLDPPKLAPAAQAPPESLETGTLNHEGIVGAAAAVDFLASLCDGADRRARLVSVAEALHARGQALFERLWEGLRSIQGVRVFGPAPDQPRTPTIAFVVDGHSSGEVARSLARRAVFVSNGDFYATTVAERLGYAKEGLVRAGCVAYTTVDEIERLIEGVRQIASA